MKKILKIVFLLAVLAIISQMFIKLFIKEHSVSYSIVASDNKKYVINEEFKKFGSKHNYNFTVKRNNKVYSFSYENDFNKQDGVINDIKYYKTGDLECIYPIYRREHVSDIYCLLDDKQVSYSYLRDSSNKDFSKVLKKLENDGYENSNYKLSNKVIKKGFISTYINNIPDDYIYTVWFYKGIYIIKDGKILEKDLLEKDRYENKLSSLVGKYYVTFNTDSFYENAEYRELILYNIKDGGLNNFELEERLSSDTYINGVYNNKLYITDNDTKKQYLFDPYNNTIEEIGNKDSGFKNFRNNELITTRGNTNNVFSDLVSNREISKLYKKVEIKKYRDNYYFKTSDGNVYEVINNQYKNPILLFSMPGIEEWKVKDGIISFIVEDTIYIYKDGYGLKPIIVDSELNYNYENIYDFMRK